ncbi:SAM-dependent methyltransferase [Streptomyces sp. NBC_00691]|uniref:SAM-dependent methyltransferase n=1 Tax=Streptomyces sp. NBC_00691 TaxID=2903671 RepID=UPI002E32574D|nr:SAM-dependent methyltransferase [Streptomyces sp. NBC_00691]
MTTLAVETPAGLRLPGVPAPRNGLRVLVTYCCQGGDSWGWHMAGFDVTGVDLNPQPRYPFPFIQGDAIEYIRAHGHEYDVHAGSPPCQAYTRCWKIQQREHPRLIGPTREAMQATGRPWVMENVEEAREEMRNPAMLCGASFGLHTYRHRLLEASFPIAVPEHPEHVHPTVKMGRPLKPGDWYHAVGNFSNVPYVKADMGVPWMTRDGIRECIPPVYGYHAATQFLAHVGMGEAQS